MILKTVYNLIQLHIESLPIFDPNQGPSTNPTNIRPHTQKITNLFSPVLHRKQIIRKPRRKILQNRKRLKNEHRLFGPPVNSKRGNLAERVFFSKLLGSVLHFGELDGDYRVRDFESLQEHFAGAAGRAYWVIEELVGFGVG